MGFRFVAFGTIGIEQSSMRPDQFARFARRDRRHERIVKQASIRPNKARNTSDQHDSLVD